MSKNNQNSSFDFQSFFPSHPVFLAPMEDITNTVFRSLCKSFGADMVYTEFISSNALIRHIQKTQEKLKISDSERPITMQIYGKEIDIMTEAARICEEFHPDFLDLNFGCPAKKIAGKGSGAGLLCHPEKMIEITRQVVRTVHIPVTIKTRLGWDENSKSIIDLAEELQDTGITMLTIHGRTRAQMYTGKADWSLIEKIKNNPRIYIPICGNGDLVSPKQCKEAFEKYGVDAIMIGRAAIGSPWLFQEIKYYLNYGQNPIYPKSSTYYLSVLKQQIIQSTHLMGERQGILHTRRHLASSNLFKGIPNFKSIKIAMLQATTLSSLFEIIDYISSLLDKENNCYRSPNFSSP